MIAKPELTVVTPAQTGTWTDLDAVLGPVEWDWEGWIARGFLHFVTAGVGIGKSLLLLSIAYTYIKGGVWPDGTLFDCPRGSVLWVETEAGQAVNLQRAKEWGVPLDGILYPLDDPLATVRLADAKHRARIREIAEDPGVFAVMVDSFSGGNGRDENAAASLPVAQGLAEIARDTNKPVIASHHLRKGRETDPDPRYGVSIERVRGHSSICQPARVIWALDFPSGPGSEMRRLHQIKNNLRPFPDALGMVVEEDGVTFGEAPEAPADASAFGAACTFLKDLLDKEPMPSAKVIEEAEKARIATRTLYRAKRALKIVSPKVQGVWMWSLPVPDGYDSEANWE